MDHKIPPSVPRPFAQAIIDCNQANYADQGVYDTARGKSLVEINERLVRLGISTAEYPVAVLYYKTPHTAGYLRFVLLLTHNVPKAKAGKPDAVFQPLPQKRETVANGAVDPERFWVTIEDHLGETVDMRGWHPASIRNYLTHLDEKLTAHREREAKAAFEEQAGAIVDETMVAATSGPGGGDATLSHVRGVSVEPAQASPRRRGRSE